VESPPERVFADPVRRPEDVAQLPAEYRDLLVRVLTIQADCEIGGPHLYLARWGLRAPSAGDQWRLVRIASEEIDHYRKFARLLEDLGVDVSDRLFVSESQRYLEAFRGEMPTWADVALFSYLIDRVGEYQLAEFEDCTYQPIAQFLPRVIAEEKGHIAFGESKLKEMLERDEERAQVLDRLPHWYATALDMFGESTSWRSRRYIRWGLKQRTNMEARDAFKVEADVALGQLGLEPPRAVVRRHQ
jgi:ring-1,2-phenylacetyl-CoA epoxidase subunit PaaA